MEKALMVAGLLVLVATTTGCTKPEQATMILERDGYTEVSIVGYYPLACGEDDTFKTGFTAMKNGQLVEGVVCSGLLKGSTVRLLN
jgi:hypothetical protein